MASAVAAATTTPGGTTTTKKSRPGMIHHRLRHQQPIDPEIASVFLTQDREVVRAQLDRALALALEAVGFDDADPLAMESFRALVEEYMEHFLQLVHRSMRASRRRMPVPLDFQTALAANNLTLRSLLPHLDPPVYDASKPRHPVLSSSKDILPPLWSRPASDEPGSEDTAAAAKAAAKQEIVLEKILNGGNGSGAGQGMEGLRNGETSTAMEAAMAAAAAAGGQQRPVNVPRGFPALPSQHTYRSRAVFAVREKNPQRIRELASEEGRLGEEALRRLAAKQAELRKAREEREKEQERSERALTMGVDGTKDPAAFSSSSSSSSFTTTSSRKKRKADTTLFRKQADGMFKDLMASVGGGDETGNEDVTDVAAATDADRDWNGGLNEPVNSERIYWRQAPKRPVANG